MGKCRKHEPGPLFSRFVDGIDGRVMIDERRCSDCRETLPLGPANDTPETAVEVRAARLAAGTDARSIMLVEALMADGDTDDHHVIRLAATIAEHPTGADQ